MKKFTTFIVWCSVVFPLSSCTHDTKVWTVRDGRDSMVVGYQMGDALDAEYQLAYKLKAISARKCASGRWTYSNDILRSQQRVGSYVLPHTNTTQHNGSLTDNSRSGYGTSYYSGTTSSTTYQTHVYTYDEQWRELDLTCLPSYAEERKSLSSDCDAGQIPKCYLLGSNYYNDNNRDKALIFWQKSCDAGYKISCARVADESGNVEKARNIYFALCNEDEAIACNNLASMSLYNAKADLPIETLQYAIEYFRKACNLGMENACKSWKQGMAELDRRLAH